MKRRYVITAIVAVTIIGLLLWLRFWGFEKTTPPPVKVVEKSYVDKVFDSMSLRDKVASLFILHTPGTNSTNLRDYVIQYKPSGLILMSDNITATTTELASLTKSLSTDSRLPLLIATDEEGDTVTRLASDTFAGAMTLRNAPPQASRDAFLGRSELLKSVGINLNFGIIADVTADSNSFIFPRVLGTNTADASARIAEAVAGTKGKTLSTLKHFPGHGETKANSHSTIPIADTSYNTWLTSVAPPFEAGIKAGADVVMFGQLAYPSVDPLPATLSKKWHGILTSTLGFKGITITDDMVMLQNSGNPRYTDPVQNAIDAINAGNTLVLFVTNHIDSNSMIEPDSLINGVVQAVEDGRVKISLVNDNVHKLLNLRFSLAT